MKKIPAWLVLMVICLVAAALLAATNLMTKDVIAANANREKMETLGKLLPSAEKFEELESGVSVGKDGDGNPVGYALAVTTQGFGGEVETTVAALADGTISGISVGGSNFAETAGLGARAKEPEFQAQFAGKTAPVSLSKDGGEIEALSGATITSRAVIKAVNEAMEGIAGEAGFTVESSSTAEHLGEGKYAATAQGFGGPVKVYLTLDENRTIQEITIGDSAFNETAGLGAKAQEEDFRKQFIGKTIPVAAGDIDAISGATITTTAVLEAISEISDGLDKGLADSPVTEEKEEASATTAEDAAAEHLGEGKYAATAQGFGGPVKVYLTLDENRTIQEITIGDSAFNETAGLGAKAQDEDFRKQFIGKTIPVAAGDIDAISGATITTTAVLEAISEISDGLDKGPADGPSVGEGEKEESGAAKEAGGTKYDAVAQGFGGPVHVYLTLDAEGKISEISIGDDDFAETVGLGAKAKDEDFRKQFIGKTIPVAAGDIDAISGATITTTAVLEAISEISDGLDKGLADSPVTEEKEETEAAPTAAPQAGGVRRRSSSSTQTSTESATEVPATAAAESGAVEHLGEGKYAATAQGFGGPVKVYLTLDENRTIQEITIGDSAFNETAGLGAKAQEEDFRKQFIGKTIPVAAGDIDAISGATITTTAVLEAISEISDGLDKGPADGPSVGEGEKEESGAAKEAGGTKYDAVAQGFGGPVHVYLTLDAEGKISEISIGDDDFAETVGLGAKAKDEDFRKQFIGKTIPVAAVDIEAISGATITTTAVLEAISEISDGLDKSPADGPSVGEGEKEESGAAKEAGGTKYDAVAQGFGGPVHVYLTLDAEGKISEISIGDDDFAETVGLGAKAKDEDFRKQFIGKSIPLTADDIDAITAATVTTGAVLEAINNIAEQMK